MKVTTVTGPGTTEIIDAAQPQVGSHDLLVRMRACGICGSDAFFISVGGVPPRQGEMPLGHEPAGEIVMCATTTPASRLETTSSSIPGGAKRHHR